MGMAKDGEGKMEAKKINAEVFRLANETLTLMANIKRKKKLWICHILRPVF